MKKYYKIGLWMIFLFLLFCLTYNMMYRKYEVHGDSMYPALKNGQFLRMKTYQKDQEVKRGQIVAIKTKIRGKECLLIKRVIGLPGDYLKEADGKLFLNGKCVEKSKAMQGETFEVDISDGQLFVMGDNRKHSLDSRELGLLEISNIVAVKE